MSVVNLGIDHDSDEVVALKATISTKGTTSFSLRVLQRDELTSVCSDNEITMLKVHLDQAAEQRAAVDVILKETNYKVCFDRGLGEPPFLCNGSSNPKPTDEPSSRKNCA